MALPELEVLIDRNEQYQLRFPETISLVHGTTTKLFKVKETKRVLAGGDYCLAVAPTLVGVERKGSIGEIRANLYSRDRKRASKAFQKFISCYTVPYLLLDMSPGAWFRESRFYDEPATEIQQRLFEFCAETGMRPVWFDTPNSAAGAELRGELVLRLLWSHYNQDVKRAEIAALKERALRATA